MVEKVRAAGDEDSSDEEFDIEALRQAPAFLNDDGGSGDNPNPTMLTLAITAISSSHAPKDYSLYHTVTTTHQASNIDRYTEEQATTSGGFRLNRLGAIRRRIMARGTTLTTSETGEYDTAGNYTRRLQEVRRRILALRTADVAENPNSGETTPVSSNQQSNSNTPPISARDHHSQNDN